VSDGTIPNTKSKYTYLSKKTAEARRKWRFPDLIDRTRQIHRDLAFTGPDDARAFVRRVYRRDRTEGQSWSIYLGVEKAGMVEQLDNWFGQLGVPILALSGYASQTYVQDVQRDKSRFNRPAVILYAGDFDPSGEDIDRDFLLRTGCFHRVIRVALSADQVTAHDLPPQVGKVKDTRAAAFIARHGELVQVELDALDPDDLRTLYQEAINQFWDQDAYDAAMAQEAEDRAQLGSDD
jgi:hypothetical protein